MRAVLITLNASILYVLGAYLINLFSVRDLGLGNELFLFAILANVAISLLLREFGLKKHAPLFAVVVAGIAVITFPFLICLAIPGVVEWIRKE